MLPNTNKQKLANNLQELLKRTKGLPSCYKNMKTYNDPTVDNLLGFQIVSVSEDKKNQVSQQWAEIVSSPPEEEQGKDVIELKDDKD